MSMYRTLLVSAVITIGGCEGSATAPRVLTTRQPTVAVSGATQDWERVTFWNDNVNAVPCAGEDFRIFGYVPYQYHEVITPSGGFDFMLQYRPETPNSPIFQAVGLTSGKVYIYSNGRPINISFHLNAAETRTAVTNEEYVAADGSKLFGDARRHFTVNANGDLAVSNTVEYELTCGSK